jgi:hypothetical protein
MPNHCNNKLGITGSTEDIEIFIKTVENNSSDKEDNPYELFAIAPLIQEVLPKVPLALTVDLRYAPNLPISKVNPLVGVEDAAFNSS